MEVKATRGCAHDCLGIIFRFVDQKARIDVVKCISNVSKEFPVKFKEVNLNIMPAGPFW